MYFYYLGLLDLYGLFEFFRGYFKSTGSKRNQLKYFCWSMLVAYCGGVLNFLPTFNIEIPILMPFGTYAIAIYAGFTAYAMLRYQLMDINVALTRVGIFVIVYLFVLGVPFWLGYKYGLWQYSTWLMLVLATTGPFIYQYLRRQAEEILLKEQKRYQQAIANLTKKIAEIRDLDKLLDEETFSITKEVKADFCLMYLKSDEYNSFRLKSAHPIEVKSRFPEFIAYNDSLVVTLNAQNKPLLSAEAGKHDKIFLIPGWLFPVLAKTAC